MGSGISRLDCLVWGVGDQMRGFGFRKWARTGYRRRCIQSLLQQKNNFDILNTDFDQRSSSSGERCLKTQLQAIKFLKLRRRDTWLFRQKARATSTLLKSYGYLKVHGKLQIANCKLQIAKEKEKDILCKSNKKRRTVWGYPRTCMYVDDKIIVETQTSTPLHLDVCCNPFIKLHIPLPITSPGQRYIYVNTTKSYQH